MLSNATHPMTTAAHTRACARARGHGHRRRISQARASRSSVYETIEEENSPARSLASKMSSMTACQPIFIVDPETASIDSLSPGSSIWDDERGIMALRKYYALRDEAQDMVTESKRQWLDTPFSVFALQCKCLYLRLDISMLMSISSLPFSQAPCWDASSLGTFGPELWSSAL
jgi:serine/arginine repetitive matrix protein 2